MYLSLLLCDSDDKLTPGQETQVLTNKLVLLTHYQDVLNKNYTHFPKYQIFIYSCHRFHATATHNIRGTYCRWHLVVCQVSWEQRAVQLNPERKKKKYKHGFTHKRCKMIANFNTLKCVRWKKEKKKVILETLINRKSHQHKMLIYKLVLNTTTNYTAVSMDTTSKYEYVVFVAITANQIIF